MQAQKKSTGVKRSRGWSRDQSDLVEPPLRVGCFNLQKFEADDDQAKTDVSEVLVKILKRYDLLLIMEPRLDAETNIDRLIKRLNTVCNTYGYCRVDRESPFDFEESEAMCTVHGHQEHYCFFYRVSKLSVMDVHRYGKEPFSTQGWRKGSSSRQQKQSRDSMGLTRSREHLRESSRKSPRSDSLQSAERLQQPEEHLVRQGTDSSLVSEFLDQCLVPEEIVSVNSAEAATEDGRSSREVEAKEAPKMAPRPKSALRTFSAASPDSTAGQKTEQKKNATFRGKEEDEDDDWGEHEIKVRKSHSCLDFQRSMSASYHFLVQLPEIGSSGSLADDEDNFASSTFSVGRDDGGHQTGGDSPHLPSLVRAQSDELFPQHYEEEDDIKPIEVGLRKSRSVLDLPHFEDALHEKLSGKHLDEILSGGSSSESLDSLPQGFTAVGPESSAPSSSAEQTGPGNDSGPRQTAAASKYMVTHIDDGEPPESSSGVTAAARTAAQTANRGGRHLRTTSSGRLLSHYIHDPSFRQGEPGVPSCSEQDSNSHQTNNSFKRSAYPAASTSRQPVRVDKFAAGVIPQRRVPSPKPASPDSSALFSSSSHKVFSPDFPISLSGSVQNDPDTFQSAQDSSSEVICATISGSASPDRHQKVATPDGKRTFSRPVFFSFSEMPMTSPCDDQDPVCGEAETEEAKGSRANLPASRNTNQQNNPAPDEVKSVDEDEDDDDDSFERSMHRTNSSTVDNVSLKQTSDDGGGSVDAESETSDSKSWDPGSQSSFPEITEKKKDAEDDEDDDDDEDEYDDELSEEFKRAIRFNKRTSVMITPNRFQQHISIMEAKKKPRINICCCSIPIRKDNVFNKVFEENIKLGAETSGGGSPGERDDGRDGQDEQNQNARADLLSRHTSDDAHVDAACCVPRSEPAEEDVMLPSDSGSNGTSGMRLKGSHHGERDAACGEEKRCDFLTRADSEFCPRCGKPLPQEDGWTRGNAAVGGVADPDTTGSLDSSVDAASVKYNRRESEGKPADPSSKADGSPTVRQFDQTAVPPTPVDSKGRQTPNNCKNFNGPENSEVSVKVPPGDRVACQYFEHHSRASKTCKRTCRAKDRFSSISECTRCLEDRGSGKSENLKCSEIRRLESEACLHNRNFQIADSTVYSDSEAMENDLNHEIAAKDFKLRRQLVAFNKETVNAGTSQQCGVCYMKRDCAQADSRDRKADTNIETGDMNSVTNLKLCVCSNQTKNVACLGCRDESVFSDCSVSCDLFDSSQHETCCLLNKYKHCPISDLDTRETLRIAREFGYQRACGEFQESELVGVSAGLEVEQSSDISSEDSLQTQCFCGEVGGRTRELGWDQDEQCETIRGVAGNDNEFSLNLDVNDRCGVEIADDESVWIPRRDQAEQCDIVELASDDLSQFRSECDVDDKCNVDKIADDEKHFMPEFGKYDQGSVDMAEEENDELLVGPKFDQAHPSGVRDDDEEENKRRRPQSGTDEKLEDAADQNKRGLKQQRDHDSGATVKSGNSRSRQRSNHAADDDCIENLEPVDYDRIENLEPVDYDRIENLQPVDNDRIENLEPVDNDRIENLEPVDDDCIENLEPVDDDRIENLEPDDDDRIENLEPDDDDRIENLEPADDDRIENLEPDDDDRIENLEPDDSPGQAADINSNADRVGSPRSTRSKESVQDPDLNHLKLAFCREPFAVHFMSSQTEVRHFTVVAIHTDTSDACREVRAIQRLYDVTCSKWRMEDVILTGDFLMDESERRMSYWRAVQIKSDRRFTDPLGGTMPSARERNYDRFVLVGRHLNRAFVSSTVGYFRFDLSLGLTSQQAAQVSDHYPIEFKLAGMPTTRWQKHAKTKVGVSIDQVHPVCSTDALRQLCKTGQSARSSAHFTTVVYCDESKKKAEVRATRNDVTDVTQCLKEFQQAFPDILKDTSVSLASSFVTSPLIERSPVHGLNFQNDVKFDVIVTVTLQEPLLCQLQILRQLSDGFRNDDNVSVKEG